MFLKKLLLPTIICLFIPKVEASSSMFIYGKVTTIDGEVYTGQIRWGKEEAYWFDFFNSTKPENENLDYLSRRELNDLNDRTYRRNNRWNPIWVSRYWSDPDHTHTFACQFGEIRSIEIRSGKKVQLHLKDGSEIRLQGGSNDIGADVQVNDPELGILRVDWDRIDRVDFMETPADLVSAFGQPLYGKVYSDEGEFTGYLQWDHDERTTEDLLDGDTEDGDLSIRFGNIHEITRRGSKGVDVTFHSGRSVYLSGSNDCNSSNRGIIVNMIGKGRVDIPWTAFDQMVIEETPNLSVSYHDFTNPHRIEGSLETVDGDKLTGIIVFDLDEERAFEMLNGKIDEVEYFIPFRAIERIQPVNDDSSVIVLHDGDKLLLEDEVDVSERNDGLLVFATGSNNPEYIPWNHVKNISFHK